MTKITLTKTHQNSPEIKQSRLRRDWMDGTYKKHAYSCLPLTSANVNGWEIILPQDVVVEWSGNNEPPKVLEGEFYYNRPLVVPSIIGIVSFTTGWAINTEEGYHTWVSGSPNFFVDGAVPLTATIPSSWWPDEFNMNWKITKIKEPVVFKKGTPYMFFNIYPTSLLPSCEFSIEYLWDKPDLMDKRQRYGDKKMKNNQENPWTWTNGIKTGIDSDGNQIGPATSGVLKLNEPQLDAVNNQ